MTTLRRWNLGENHNTRDLGGYAAPGGVTAWNRFLRSDFPTNFSEEDWDRLRRAGFTTVIDLRGNQEFEQEPNIFAGRLEFDLYHVSLFPDQPWSDDPDEVPQAYFSMTAWEEQMAQVMHTIARAPGGVYFHCRAGKDRTGVVAALLLMLAGVSDNDLLADYMLSASYLELRWRQQAFFMAKFLPQMSHMRGFLKLFREAYGDVERYLAKIGLTPEEIRGLKDRLVDRA